MNQPLTKKAQKAAEVLANRREAFGKRVRSLLGHVRVPEHLINAAFAKADQYSYVEVADAFAAAIAAKEPVGAAIHALKVEATEHAERYARERVAKVEKELAENGGDLNAYAPYPRSRGWQMTPQEEAARDFHNFVMRLTESDPAKGYQSYDTDRPYYRVMDAKSVEKFVNDAREAAAIQYDMFICKMVAKVGEAISAELDGSHVWSISYLTVEKPGGREIWKTQQIVNYSKYGRPYYQWPSRKLKGKGLI